VTDLEVRDAEPEADRAWLDRLALHAVAHWTPPFVTLDMNGSFCQKPTLAPRSDRCVQDLQLLIHRLVAQPSYRPSPLCGREST